jgi:hypothetical protein
MEQMATQEMMGALGVPEALVVLVMLVVALVEHPERVEASAGGPVV